MYLVCWVTSLRKCCDRDRVALRSPVSSGHPRTPPLITHLPSSVLRTGNGTIPDPYLYDIQPSTPGTYSDVYNPAGSTCGSGEGPSCLALCNANPDCAKYFVSNCSQPCCSGTSDPMYALGYQNETSACAALEDFDGTGTPSYLDFAGAALLCTGNGGLALGDPHFFGFDVSSACLST